ncbi:MAG: RDD family protein [Gammaproteobacteria bacterium]|nr:RDD family protein [Gammaproteobacteria bacterium]
MASPTPPPADTGHSPGLIRRLLSIIYDTLLIGGLLFLAMALVVVALGVFSGWDHIDTESLRNNPLYISYLLMIPLLFFVGFWRAGGQTLGMRAWRLRIVADGGIRPSVSACIIRCLAALLSWAICGLGFLWILVDRKHLAWHDRLSKTYLVMVPKGG